MMTTTMMSNLSSSVEHSSMQLSYPDTAATLVGNSVLGRRLGLGCYPVDGLSTLNFWSITFMNNNKSTSLIAIDGWVIESQALAHDLLSTSLCRWDAI